MQEPTNDLDAKLYSKTSTGEARLSYLEHITIEKYHGQNVDTLATEVDGTAARDAAVLILPLRWKLELRRRTVGVDKFYATFFFV